jgi:ATP-dependent protease HslVU (ClpYQ) peptidase subunit
MTYVEAKVWSDSDFIFGNSGSVRQGQLLRHKLIVSEQRGSQSVEEYMVCDFVDAVRQCFRDNGLMKVHDSVESGGLFLVGYRGRLFRIDSDYQVGESADGYDAIGCGDEVAKGALHVLTSHKPEERIRQALAASEHINKGVRAPFVVEKLEA